MQLGDGIENVESIQHCCGAAVLHTPWPALQIQTKQPVIIHVPSCSLGEALPPHLFPTSCIIPLCCSAPLLQMWNCSSSLLWWPTKCNLTETVSQIRNVHLQWRASTCVRQDFALLLPGGHSKHSVAGLLHRVFWFVLWLAISLLSGYWVVSARIEVQTVNVK